MLKKLLKLEKKSSKISEKLSSFLETINDLQTEFKKLSEVRK